MLSLFIETAFINHWNLLFFPPHLNLHLNWKLKKKLKIWNLKNQEPRDVKREFKDELKQKVSQDQKLKQRKAKEGFRGLQASERPIVFRGRKWRNAQDAFNEEMIAEIISSQAELIMGTTLGYLYIFYFFIWIYCLSHYEFTSFACYRTYHLIIFHFHWFIGMPTRAPF